MHLFFGGGGVESGHICYIFHLIRNSAAMMAIRLNEINLLIICFRIRGAAKEIADS